MIETTKGLSRTKYCGEFTKDDLGKSVTVFGWVQRSRNLGGLIFADIRDREGIMQCQFDEARDKELFDKAVALRSEFVVAVRGTVAMRGESAVNKNMPTGEVEIIAEELRILSVAKTPPFEILPNTAVNEELRLRHRYLDLRRSDLQANILLRSKLYKSVRDYYAKFGFVEVETPILMKSTPEGARDYLVPSRIHNGSFYALPQSPQLYKQLTMISGFDRYIQIAKCFRDEDLRADRQPEFTQVDVEMSFVDIEDVMSMNENMVKYVWEDILGVKIEEDFERLTYNEAMSRFGSDKPDMRFGMELRDISVCVLNTEFKVFKSAIENGGSVRAINVKNSADKFTRKEIDALAEWVKTYRAKGLAWIKLGEETTSSFTKFLSEGETAAILSKVNAEKNDLIFVVADENKVVFDSLGALRCELAKRLSLYDKNDYKFLWVTEFPLLDFDEEAGRYVAMHHPFTSPMDDDVELLYDNPNAARAKAYDIVCNGYELGGGSIRIYNADVQSQMFSLLGFSEEEAKERFGFFLEAFQYGVPPHGGIAFGVDRMAMLLAKTDNIKDVIAFPKVQNASELMSDCPNVVSQKQLEELGIAIVTKD